MGTYCHYEVVSAKATKELGTFDGTRLVLCDGQCKNEHGHTIAPFQNAVVAIQDGIAQFEGYPENFLPEDTNETERQEWETLCKANPDYYAYNDREFAALLG